MPLNPKYPPFYFLISIIIMCVLWIIPSPIIIRFPWNFAALPIIIAGLALIISGARLFAIHKTPIIPFTTSTSLIQQGVFRISRNPIYLGMTLTLLAIAALMGTALPFVPAIIFPLFIHYRYVKEEERILGERFGERYEHYKARTRRWI